MLKRNILFLLVIMVIIVIRCGLFEPEEQKGSICIRLVTKTNPTTLAKTQESLSTVRCIVKKGSSTIHDQNHSKSGGSFKIDITELDPGDNYSVLLYGKNSSGDIIGRGYKSGISVKAGEVTNVSMYWNKFKPVLNTPGNGTTINDNTPTFDWTSVSVAVSYELVVDNSSSFGSPEIHQTNLGNSTYTASSSLSENTYYWRVRAKDSQGNWGGWSDVWNFKIELNKVATPTFSPSPGTYTTAQDVTISCTTSGATIHYTTNGTDPTDSSPVYSSAIHISSTTTLKARAYRNGWNPSDVASGTYTITDGTLKWKYETGNAVFSSPAIGTDGTICFGSADHYLYALNPEGTLKWKYKTGGWVASSPAVDTDGTIYFGSADHYLYALNPDGTLKWKYKAGSDVASSPAIGTDGTIYFGSYDAYFYALNPDGTLKWKYKAGNAVFSSPAVGTDGTLYFGSGDSYLYALNPDGTLKWKYETNGFVDSSPAIGTDGTLYFGSGDSYFYALNSDGTLKWKYETGDLVESSPAIGTDGTIYFGSDDNYLYAFNPDGTLKWKYKTGSYVGSSPAIGTDGTIYFGSDDNYLYAFNPDGTLKWKYKTGSYVDSSPAIGTDGIIYFGSRGNYFYALKSSSLGLASNPWPKFRHDNRNTGRVE